LAHDYARSPFEALLVKNAFCGDGVGMINCTVKTSFLTLYAAKYFIRDEAPKEKTEDM
jgi:hypothetical protein